MNTVSLNNLWSYLQGLTLTASNKRWLADHLYESAKMEERPMTREEKLAEAARIRKEKEKALWADMPKMSKEELEPSREILDIVKEVEPMPDDVDIERIKYEYLMKKYG
ncbi:MAG: hypothetical protein II864_03565 [Prevotella sp.]|nr:hypothetical protein [Prevotella sp.]